MTFSVSAPTNNTGALLNNGTEVLSVESDNSIDIDSGTFHVDATNNRVGIGTNSPTVPLEVSSDLTPAVNILCTGSSPNTGLLVTKQQGSGDLADWNAITINGNDNVSYESRIQWQFDSLANGPIVSGKRVGAGETEFYVYTNLTETPYKNLRIDAYGNYDFGHVTEAQIKFNGMTAGAYVDVKHPSSAGSGYGYVRFFHNGSIIGQIAQNGTTAVSYNTTSDYRLKNNVASMSGGIDRLKQLKPSTWSWVQDGSHGEGFLAHEAQEVVPEAVTGTKDEVDDEGNPVYQGIDQSKLVPLLTSALQEAITKIESLEERIQALESN